MKSILASISQPKEIQNLNLKELTQLAAECRQRIIEVTSQRGGHLASSLGTVEIKELTQLAAECRQRIIEVTSQRGGHLASSLGTVEITVALLKNYDFSLDRIVWDVGHQRIMILA